MTYKTLVNGSESLSSLSQEKLSVKEAVALARLIKATSDELEIFTELRAKLLKTYGKLNEEKGEYEFSKENGKKFSDEMKELLDTEIKVKIEKVKITTEIRLAAADVLKLEEFIEF